MTYIKAYHAEQEFSTAERCTINELSNHIDDNDCSIAKAMVLPGISTQLHALNNTIERYIILEADEAYVEINYSPPEKVNRFDIVTIPAGLSQKITNYSDTKLIFLCICTPRFKQADYTIVNESIIEYAPVSCELHSDLELAIIEKQSVLISYDHPDSSKPVSVPLYPHNIIIRNLQDQSVEFLLATDNSGKQLELRLDFIQIA